MVKIVITRKDGSVYWTEAFNSMQEATAWVDEERTRPYWDPDFVVDIQDGTAEAEEQMRKARETEIARLSKGDEIKTLVKKKNRNVAEANAIIDKMAELLGLT